MTKVFFITYGFVTGSRHTAVRGDVRGDTS